MQISQIILYNYTDKIIQQLNGTFEFKVFSQMLSNLWNI